VVAEWTITEEGYGSFYPVRPQPLQEQEKALFCPTHGKAWINEKNSQGLSHTVQAIAVQR
jgi:hypothetical protein